MTIEAVQYISDLNSSFPRSTDLLREGDDHIRMIKNSLRRTFPNIKGAVQVSETFLNNLASTMNISSSGVTFTKSVSLDSNRITNVADPVSGTDAVNMSWLYKTIIQTIFPVGSLWFAGTSTQDPNSMVMFSGTKWERYAHGYAIIGSDGTNPKVAAGATTGGATTSVRLAASNIPAHTHTISHGHSASSASAGNHAHNIKGAGANNLGNGDSIVDGHFRNKVTNTTESAGAHSHGITVNNFNGNSGTGNGLSGAAFNVSTVQPSIGVNIWRRTA